MSKFLKFLSILTGSTEETLLNARAEVSNNFGRGVMSNREEQLYALEKILNDMPRFFSIEEVNGMYTTDIVAKTIERYLHKEDVKFIQILNRVLVYYYNYEIQNQQTLVKALVLFSRDLELYAESIANE